MLDILANFDALGLGTLAGSILFLAGLLWVLLDNRSFRELNRIPGSDGPVSAEPTRSAGAQPPGETVPAAHMESGPRPGRPRRPRRAA